LFAAISLNSQVLFKKNNNDDITYSNAFAFVMACLSLTIEDSANKPLHELISILKYFSVNDEKIWNDIISRLSEDDRNHLNNIMRS